MSEFDQTEYLTVPMFFTVPLSDEGCVLSTSCAARVDESLVAQYGADFLNESSVSGVVLLKASNAQKSNLESTTGLKLVENRHYELPHLYPMNLYACETSPVPFEGSHAFNFYVVDENDEPVENVAFVADFGNITSTPIFSNSSGEVSFQLGVAAVRSFHVRPRQDYWPILLLGRQFSELREKISLTRIDPKNHERFAELLGKPSLTDGKGVKIAVIDTGVARHRDLQSVVKRLVVSKGVVEEDSLREVEWHGTHVAGIIGCRNDDFLGHAPAAQILSYRVCAAGKRCMSTADVFVAIVDAVNNGADIINLSLGFNVADEAIADAINFAHSSGVLVIAAVGNDAMSRSSFPAGLPDVIAVSAVGRAEAYPLGSVASLHTARTESEGYFAPYFANFGEGHVGCAAPGVGIVSTVNESGYQAESGTSMATPVISALAATLLSQNLTKLGARTPQRLSRLRDMLYTSCRRAGFHADHVGHGVPFVRG